MRRRLHQQGTGSRPSLIETPSACAAQVRYHGVEDLTVALVGIEAFVKKIAEPASRLRCPKCKRVFGGNCRIRRVLDPRSRVSHGGESKAGYRRGPTHKWPLKHSAPPQDPPPPHPHPREAPPFPREHPPPPPPTRAAPGEGLSGSRGAG